MRGFNKGALPGEKFEEFGRDYDESIKLAKLLEEAGADAFSAASCPCGNCVERETNLFGILYEAYQVYPDEAS